MTAEGISVNLCIEITPEQWCAISASRRGEFYGYWTKAEDELRMSNRKLARSRE
jgi:hypothetical protein